jgi:chemotaxis protein MotC
MRRRLKLAGAALACALAGGSLAFGQDSKGEPFELVRSLQSVQDQVVRGNARAHAAQRVLLGRIAEQFDALSPEGWKDQRNARAAVVFVLSGGSARVLQKLVGSAGVDGVDEKLIKGVMAYGEGRRDEAAELLKEIDARALGPGMAGHVAYVQGDLAAKKEPAKALAYLDDARLLSPGTIIEEAALRRGIALLAAAGDADRYEALATQYLRRFPSSVYAGSFRQQFAIAIATHTNAGEPGRLSRLETMLSGVQHADRRDVFLTIAKEALDKGKVEMASFAAMNAARLAEEQSSDRERARVYEGAALIATDDFERGVEMLGAVERNKLVETDAVLLDSALGIAGQVRRLPDGPEPESEPPAVPGAAGLGGSEILERARKTIAQVDAMLAEAAR